MIFCFNFSKDSQGDRTMDEVRIRSAGTMSRQIVQMHEGRLGFRPEVIVSRLFTQSDWVELFFPENIWGGGSPGELWENEVISSRIAMKVDRLGRAMVVTVVRPIRRVETGHFMYVDHYGRVIEMSQSAYSVKEKIISTTKRIVTFEDGRGKRYEYEEFRNNGLVVFRRQLGTNPVPKDTPLQLSSRTTTQYTNVIPMRR